MSTDLYIEAACSETEHFNLPRTHRFNAVNLHTKRRPELYSYYKQISSFAQARINRTGQQIASQGSGHRSCPVDPGPWTVKLAIAVYALARLASAQSPTAEAYLPHSCLVGSTCIGIT